MKLALTALVLFFAQLAAADHFQDSKACFYDHDIYKGPSFCLAPGQTMNDLSRTGWNKRISSVRVFGSARVTLYDQFNFQGRFQVINGNWAYLSRFDNFNDATSSIRVETVGNQACFFEYPEYSGVSMCLKEGSNAGNFFGMNDRTESIRLDGDVSAHVYEHADFAGSMLSVRQSIWTMRLSTPAWRDIVSSAKIRRQNERP